MKPLIVLCSTALFFIGCSTQAPTPKHNSKPLPSTPQTHYPLIDGMPIWISQPDYQGFFGEVGSASPSTRGGKLAQERVAKAIARANLAKRLTVQVKSFVEVSKKSDTKKSTLTARSMQEANAYLAKSRIEDRWRASDGTLFIWMIIPQP